MPFPEERHLLTRGISMPEEKKPHKVMPPADCENCQYYDYDEEYDCYMCSMDLDEDEYLRVMEHGAPVCPFYRYYDEYTMVRKQN